MEFRFSGDFKSIVFLVVLAGLLIAGLGLGAFFLGQLTALRLANQLEQPAETVFASQTTSLPGALQATLPVAMTATPKPVGSEEIIFTDAQATDMAQQQAGQVNSEIPFAIERVFFTPGKANLTGTVEYLGASSEFNLTGTPYVENKRLRVRVDSLTIGGLPVPGSFYAEIENQLNAMFEQVFSGYEVQSVVVEEGLMRLGVVAW